MSKRELHIGYDNTLAAEVDDGRLSGNDVYVVAHNGRVTIEGPFLDWEGFKVLAEFEDTDAGERLAEIKAVAELWAEWDKRRLHVSDSDRWQQRALRAEGKLAELGRMLDEYRDKGRPMPTYAELIRLLQG